VPLVPLATSPSTDQQQQQQQAVPSLLTMVVLFAVVSLFRCLQVDLPAAVVGLSSLCCG
jgi:hypothetical protein